MESRGRKLKQKLLIKNIKTVYGIPQLSDNSSILIDEKGNIEAVGNISQQVKYRILDASGLSFSPGWIDMHTHIYYGVTDIALNSDLIGPKQGVSILVDAGSAGHITYKGFKKYIIESGSYGIYTFLNLGSLGIIRTNIIGDYETDDFIQPKETIKCIMDNRDYIRGVKVRACTVVLKGRDVEVVEQASDVAKEVGLPLMVHIGEPNPLLGNILNVLQKGDIVTHCFHGKPGGILSSKDGSIIIEACRARERGVLFDVGHGGASFNYNVGLKAIKMDFKPDLISTDLHERNINGPVYSLAITLSKMAACGLSTEEIIERITLNAANVLKIETFQSSLIGKKSRFTLFELKDQEKIYNDSEKNPIHVPYQFIPRFTVIGNKITRCSQIIKKKNMLRE